MANEHLHAADRAHALNPTPTGDRIVEYYVPFEELIAGARIETALSDAVEAGQRVAIVGPSGSGKTSLCEWVLGQEQPGFATVRIPVGVEREEIVSEPDQFLQHVIRTLTQYALDASLINVKEREQALRASGRRIMRPGIQTTDRAALGLPRWLLQGDVARDVTAFVEGVDQDRSAGAILEVLRRLIAFISDLELRPIFLIDDSDAWLNIDGVTDRTGLISAFFGRVLRVLAELPAGLVVAVHASYLEREGFREQVEGFLERKVEVPLLTNGAVGQVLLHRLRSIDGQIEVADVFTPEAIDELHGYYGGAARASVRRTLQVAQRAVQVAAEAGSEVVSPEVVEAAVSDWV